MRNWWRNRKRKRALAKRQKLLEGASQGTELREFVYLDETSVYSLVASRLGPIATEQTDSTAASWESQAAGKVGADLIAFDLESSAQFTRSRSQNSQILRKSVIQTTFKDLLEMEKSKLLLCSEKGFSGARERGEVLVPASTLKRGALIELEVELGVEDVFRMVTVISSMMGMFESGTQFFPAELLQKVEQGRALEGIIRVLLTGLVPIRARVLDHEVYEKQGELFLKSTPTNEDPAGPPLYLVGVAEERLFWKDMRRVLFSNGRYKVLARLSQDGLPTAWTPVKLAHVVEKFIPNFSTQLTEGFWKGMSKERSGALQGERIEKHSTLGAALRAFEVEIAAHMGPDRIPKTLEKIRADARFRSDHPFDFDAYREACTDHAKLAAEESGQTISPAEVSALRERARAQNEVKVEERPPTSATRERFLDCEIVAIYW